MLCPPKRQIAQLALDLLWLPAEAGPSGGIVSSGLVDC